MYRTKFGGFVEKSAEKSQWLTIYLKDKNGETQDVTVFDVTLYDLINACEKAILKDKRVLEEELTCLTNLKSGS